VALRPATHDADAGMMRLALAVAAALLGRAAGADVDVARYAHCDGAVDDTDAVRTALHAAAGGTLRVPAGCLLLLRSPGPDGASLVIPSHTHVACESGAAFVLARRRCGGGTYPGAACRADAECIGGGTCGVDGDLPGEYAPDAAARYTVFLAEAASTEVAVTGCHVRVHGADDFLRCVGGRNDGRPCEQYCDAGPLANVSCTDDAPCGAGHHCVNRADCTGAGGTCTGPPGRPSGPGRIDVVDLAGATHATVERNVIADHRQGDVSITVGDDALVADNDTLATVDTRPPTFPPAEVAASYTVGSALVAANGARIRGNTLRAAVSVVRAGAYALIAENTILGTGPATAGVYLTGQQDRVVGNQVSAFNCVRGEPLRVANVTVVGNRCLWGKGAKIVVTGAGWTVADNYLAWGTSAAPVVQLGSPDALGAGTNHAIVSGNILHSDQADAVLIGVADVGKRCTGGAQSGRACAAAADCPDSACAVTQHGSGLITGNLFYRGAPGQVGIDLGMGPTPSGGTVITGWGITGNHFVAQAVGIRLPATPGLVSATNVVGNSFADVGRAAVENWSWTAGTLADNGPLDATTDAVTVVRLRNGEAEAAVPGDAVEVDPSADDTFRRARSPHALGIVLDAPAAGKPGQVAVRGTTRCNLDGTPVPRGSALAVSATPGKLRPAAATERSVAVSLGAGTTSVRCLVGS
jgi:hypothetical protein